MLNVLGTVIQLLPQVVVIHITPCLRKIVYIYALSFGGVMYFYYMHIDALTWRSDFAKNVSIHHHSQERHREIFVSIPDDEGTYQLLDNLNICF